MSASDFFPSETTDDSGNRLIEWYLGSGTMAASSRLISSKPEVWEHHDGEGEVIGTSREAPGGYQHLTIDGHLIDTTATLRDIWDLCEVAKLPAFEADDEVDAPPAPQPKVTATRPVVNEPAPQPKVTATRPVVNEPEPQPKVADTRPVVDVDAQIVIAPQPEATARKVKPKRVPIPTRPPAPPTRNRKPLVIGIGITALAAAAAVYYPKLAPVEPPPGPPKQEQAKQDGAKQDQAAQQQASKTEATQEPVKPPQTSTGETKPPRVSDRKIADGGPPRRTTPPGETQKLVVPPPPPPTEPAPEPPPRVVSTEEALFRQKIVGNWKNGVYVYSYHPNGMFAINELVTGAAKNRYVIEVNTILIKPADAEEVRYKIDKLDDQEFVITDGGGNTTTHTRATLNDVAEAMKNAKQRHVGALLFEFLRKHHEKASLHDLAGYASDYAPGVKYQDKGSITIDEVKAEEALYHRKWPVIKETITGVRAIDASVGGWWVDYNLVKHLEDGNSHESDTLAEMSVFVEERPTGFVISAQERNELPLNPQQ